MGLFDFIRRKNTENRSPETIINRLVYYMPDFYTTHRQFKNCIDFSDHHEWGLAVDSFIELVSETGHYFAEDFWVDLAEAAEKMGMRKEVELCKQQIERNIKDIKFGTPFGWTTVKFDDNHFQHYISDIIKNKWVSERRIKDNVLAILHEDGVHLKSHGRTGFIYCVDKHRIAEIEFELGVKGLILYFESVVNWELPTKIKMEIEEKQKLKQQITEWAQTSKNAIDFN